MKELRKKLKDQSGASILLALLFFLLCGMVGASVLMAAVSNAGKARSNREEQQKYLLLSSALQLVCDELTSAKYTGAYSDTKYTVEVPKRDEYGNVMKDEDGNDIVDYSYDYHEYEQLQKTDAFTCGLSDVLPLLRELDYLFAATFPPSGYGLGEGDDIYTRLPGSYTDVPGGTHELTVSVDSGPDGLTDEVTIKLWMNENYSIRLTAALADDNDHLYEMEAQLTPSGTTPDMEKLERGALTWDLALIAKKIA